MTKGDGNITEIKNPKTGKSYNPKKFRVRVACGWNVLKKRYDYKQKIVNGTKADAVRVRDQFRKERDSGLSFNAASMTFEEFSNDWLKRRIESGEYTKRTLADDALRIRGLNNVIGGIKVKDITAAIAEDALRYIKAHPQSVRKSRVKTLSGTSMHKYYVSLNQIMKAAVKRDLILRNPCDRIDPPKNDTTEHRQPLNAEEAARFLYQLDKAEAKEYEVLAGKEQRQEERGNRVERTAVRGVSHLSMIMAVRLCAASGSRIGETLALEWRNVSKDCSKIEIVQAMDLGLTTKEPKSDSGIRNITLDESTAAHLKKWRRIQGAALRTLGITNTESIPVCCTDIGGYINYANFSRWFRPWREKNGFPGLKPHELRHTHATLLIGNGVDIKTVQTRLGHSKASTTIDLYTHAIPKNDEIAASLFGQLMEQTENKKAQKAG